VNARYSLGIDLGITSRHRAVLFDTQLGKPIFKRFTFPHTAAGFESLKERIQRAIGDGKVQAVMEPTGKVWVPLAGWLRERGTESLMTSPVLAAAYRRKRQKGGQSNQIDADTLARLPQAEGDRLNPACLREQKAGDLNEWCKFHEKTTRQIAAIKNRIYAELQPISPNLMKCFGEDPFAQLGRAWLKRYVNPSKLLKRGQNRVVEMLTKHSRSPVEEVTEVVKNLFASARSALELHQPIEQGQGMSYSFDSIQVRVKMYLKQLEMLEGELKDVEKQIADLHQEIDPHAASRSLPGFGAHIAPVVDSAVADIRRFGRADSFAAYVRTVPRQRSTGNGAAPGQHERQPLRKEGNRYLQKQFYLAADVARRYDVELAKAYLDLKSKGRHHNQCVVAVARRLSMRYYSLKKRQLTDPKATYQFRDLNGRPITKKEAKELADELYAKAETKMENKKPKMEPPTHTAAQTSTNQTVHISELVNELAASIGIDPQQLDAHLDQLKTPTQDDLQVDHKRYKNPLANT